MKTEGKITGFQPKFPIRVQIVQGDTNQSEFVFNKTFRIGRDPSCQIQLKNTSISRQHVEIRLEKDGWWACDLGSSNGTFVDGVRIREIRLPDQSKLEAGKSGSVLTLTVENPNPQPAGLHPKADLKKTQGSVTEVINRYLVRPKTEPMGDHTMTIRRAFDRVKKKQSRKYFVIIGGVMVLLLMAGAMVVYQEMKIQNMKGMAEDIFYTMKSVEVQLGKVERVVLSGGDAGQRSEIAEKRGQIRQMQRQYNNFVKDIGIYGKEMTEEEKIIYRIARIFGECELNMPPDFVDQVKLYIRKWQSSDRLVKALDRSHRNQYAPKISNVFLENNLPPQFFYLALQESDFKARSVGPPTRFGIAKGMWQFIPSTALEYGLQTGPLLEVTQFDPRDERFHFEKATSAAASYLRDIYNTEAQASGLLVIASYNWGHNRVRRLIQGMPENPRERNFWKLLEHYKIPRETYDYVFYIFSAAVIGEDPGLFGFDFEKPLSRIGEI